MDIIFKNITSIKIKQSFRNVFKKYTNLHCCKIIVIQKRIGKTTMQAQPVINLKTLFFGQKIYKITIGEFLKDTDIKLETIPEAVLKGWFAHELGHVEDYENHSILGMVWYGIKYLISNKFKKKVEYTADYIALKKGFKNELLKTKRYILLSNIFSDAYLINVNKYYMPLDTVLNYIENNEQVKLSRLYHE